MNKLKVLALFILSLVFVNTYSQSSGCITNIASLTDTVACGESLFLQQVGVGGASSDNFSGSTLSGLWDVVTPGFVLGGPCGVNPNGGPVLWFASGSSTPRRATTVPVDASCGGNICFDFRMETQGGATGCDGPDLANEGVYLEYRTTPTGPWTQIYYFSPIGFPYTGWQNHCFPIPAGAITTATQFRWSQTSTSGTSYDFWGIDNVNIATCAGYSAIWNGGSLNNYTFDTVTVNPTQNTTYNLLYSNFIDDTCYASIDVFVNQPKIQASSTSSSCAGSDTLNVEATIKANCYYELELWNYLPPPGATQSGWGAGVQSGVPIFHNLDLNVNGNLYSNYTMVSGANNTSVSYPLYVTDGDIIEAFFTALGTSANEAMYRIKDSQGNYLIINPSGASQIARTTQGFPGSPPLDLSVLQGNAIIVSCPTTSIFTYTWSNLTNGGISGLSPSANISNPIATVAVATDFQVIATDSLNPGCSVIDTVTVQPNINSISAVLSGPTAICLGDPVSLSWNLLGTPPFDLVLNDGISNFNYQLDAFGFQTNGLGPITFYPSISTTYSVVSIFDASGCPASVTNPTLSVTVSSTPNTGASSSVTLCNNDPNLYDLSAYLGTSDPNGTWTGPGSSVLPAPPLGTSTFNFDPTSDPSGVYTYSIVNAPCPSRFSTVTVSLNSAPSAGTSTNVTYCSNDPSVDLFNLLNGASPTGIWTQSGIGPSYIFDPSISSPGNYDYTVTDPNGACSPITSTINVNINPIPTSNINLSSTSICDGECIDLIFNLTGSAPFNLVYTDPNINNLTLNSSGFDNLTNLPINICPNSTTNFSIVSLTDDNGCTSTLSSSVVVNVTSQPFAGNNNTVDICSDDNNVYQIHNYLGGSQDLSGFWTLPNTIQLPNNSNFNFDPQTMQAGNYTYTVSAAPCNPSSASVTVNFITAPSSGIANNSNVCINNFNASNTFNLFNLLNNYDIGGNWYLGNSTTGINISSDINPNIYGVGSHDFTYEVVGQVPCANALTTVTLTINPEPVINSFTAIPTTVSQGNPTTLSIEMSIGTAPITIIGDDNDIPQNPFQIVTNPSLIGSTQVFPNVITPYTSYSISSITDANGCSTTSNLSTIVDVEPYAVLSPLVLSKDSICDGEISNILMTLSQGETPVTINYSINGNNFTEIIGIAGQVPPVSVNVPIANSLLQFGNNIISVNNVVDASGQTSPSNRIPQDINLFLSEIPTLNLSISNSEICDGELVSLNFNFLKGTPPFNINYLYNSVIQTSLTFASNGLQNHLLDNPYPIAGLNSYQVNSIVDAYGCVNNTPSQILDLIVNESPYLDIAVTGKNPICIGESSEISFPVFSGASPFNLTFEDGTKLNNVLVDNNGLVNGIPLSINPITNTTYTLKSATDSKGCSTNLNNSISLIVNDLPNVNIYGNNESCQGEVSQLYFDFTSGISPWTVSYTVNGTPTTAVLTNFNDSISVSPSSSSLYNFRSVSDLNCSNSLNNQVNININPNPSSTISGGGSICDDGSETEIFINTISGTPPFNVEYYQGANTLYLSNIGYNHTIKSNSSGNYSLKKIIDSKGCKASLNGSAKIFVNPLPQVDFTYYPEIIDISNPIVYFTDLSSGHSSGFWDFGDNSSFLNTNFNEVSHLYNAQDSGKYIVTLEISSDSNCINSTSKEITIKKSFSIYIPEAFTPNNDLKNDHFMPIVDGTKSYEFNIYNRYGQSIFSSNLPSSNYCVLGCKSAWNGKLDNSNEYATSGHYAYSIIIKDFNGKKHSFEGTLTLIR